MNGKPQPLIRLRGVSRVFLTEDLEIHALSSLDLEIHRGEFLSIAGPSGCGKSTLLAILGLLDAPTDGEFWLNGSAAINLSIRQRARLRNQEIGFIFQNFNLIGDMNVAENVELPLTYRSMSKRKRRELVGSALDRVGMTHRMSHYPAQLSGGQQQRVAVARAIAGNPAILLADEPTGNLDSASGKAVMELLQQLHREGSTICMVTHDPRYMEFATRTIHMLDGRIEQVAAAARDV